MCQSAGEQRDGMKRREDPVVLSGRELRTAPEKTNMAADLVVRAE